MLRSAPLSLLCPLSLSALSARLPRRPRRLRRGYAPCAAAAGQSGLTALHLAAAAGSLPCLRVLATAGADVAAKELRVR